MLQVLTHFGMSLARELYNLLKALRRGNCQYGARWQNMIGSSDVLKFNLLLAGCLKGFFILNLDKLSLVELVST